MAIAASRMHDRGDRAKGAGILYDKRAEVIAMAQKEESPAGKQGQSVTHHKNTQFSQSGKKHINYTDTQSDAFAVTSELRITERKLAYQFFVNHPDKEYSRADLSECLNLPINHITRIAYELLETGEIEVVGKHLNYRSQITVQMLRLAKQPQEHTLFDGVHTKGGIDE